MFKAFVDCEAITECVSPQIYKDIVPLYMKKYGKKGFNKNKPKRFQSQKTDLKQIDNLVNKHDKIIKKVMKSPEMKNYNSFPTFHSFNGTALQPTILSFMENIIKGTDNNERVGNVITAKYLHFGLEIKDATAITAPVGNVAQYLNNIYYARVLVVLDRNSEANNNASIPGDALIYSLFQINLTTDTLPINQDIDPDDPTRFKVLKDKKYRICRSVKMPQWDANPNYVFPASTGEYRHMLKMKIPIRGFKIHYNEDDQVVSNNIYVITVYEGVGVTGQAGVLTGFKFGYTDQ